MAISQIMRQQLEKISKIEGIEYQGNGVFHSINYSFLKFYKGNRFVLGNPDAAYMMKSSQEISEATKRFNKIKEYFKKYAQEQNSNQEYLFDKSIPLVIAEINDEFIIVDGQNRLSVCRELGIPFYFRFLDNIHTEEDLLSYIKRLNYINTAWSKAQQVASDARMGNPYAKAILDIENEYKIPISNTLYFTMGKTSHKTRIDFVTTPFDINRAKAIAKLIDKIANNSATSAKKALSLKKDNRFTNFVTWIVERNKIPQLERASVRLKVDKIKGAKNILDYVKAYELENLVLDLTNN